MVLDTRALATFGSLWALCAVLAGVVATEKNRRFWIWFALGLLTGPIGLYLALRSYEVVPPALAQTCPGCQRQIRKTAKACPRCGHVLESEPDRVQKASRQAAAAWFIVRRAARRSSSAAQATREKIREVRRPNQS